MPRTARTAFQRLRDRARRRAHRPEPLPPVPGDPPPPGQPPQPVPDPNPVIDPPPSHSPVRDPTPAPAPLPEYVRGRCAPQTGAPAS